MSSNEKETVLSQIFKLILAPVVVALLVGGRAISFPREPKDGRFLG